MMFPYALPDEHLERYFRVIQGGLVVKSHVDLLQWLQGEIQHYLPHEILLAVWRDTVRGHLRHDVVSALPGVRSTDLQSEDLRILQQRLYGCWAGLGKMPFRLSIGAHDLKFENLSPLFTFGHAMHAMRSLLVHGISDARQGQDCLYMIFSSTDSLTNSTLAAMENLVPYIDTALRRLMPLPSRGSTVRHIDDMPPRTENYGLSRREVEILDWVRIGKTNAEIALILEISVFTVKNHMQSILKKLDVCNRMQAVARVGAAPAIT